MLSSTRARYFAVVLGLAGTTGMIVLMSSRGNPLVASIPDELHMLYLLLMMLSPLTLLLGMLMDDGAKGPLLLGTAGCAGLMAWLVLPQIFNFA